MSTEELKLDLARQDKAIEYARIRRRLLLIDLIIGGVYLCVWLFTGWSTKLKDWLSTFTSNDWLLVACFGLVFGVIYILISLPLSYYSGYHLPHRYDQSNQTLKGWIIDQIKGLALSGFLGGLVLEIIYTVLRAAPETWWLWAAGILLLFNVILANLAPVLLMPIFFKFTPLGEEHQELINQLMALASQAGTNVKGVYKFDMSRRTKSANAALTGLGNTRRIILGDTLLDEFTSDEIETVLAHELGHHVHKDIVWGIIIGTLSTIIGFYLVSLGLNWSVANFGFESPADIAALPLFGIVMALYGLVTMPLDNAYSRWRERKSDRYALEMTRNGPAFASAFTRLANQNLAEIDPEPWVEFLLHGHPSLAKRIRMANEYEHQDLQQSG